MNYGVTGVTGVPARLLPCEMCHTAFGQRCDKVCRAILGQPAVTPRHTCHTLGCDTKEPVKTVLAHPSHLSHPQKGLDGIA